MKNFKISLLLSIAILSELLLSTNVNADLLNNLKTSSHAPVEVQHIERKTELGRADKIYSDTMIRIKKADSRFSSTGIPLPKLKHAISKGYGIEFEYARLLFTIAAIGKDDIFLKTTADTFINNVLNITKNTPKNSGWHRWQIKNMKPLMKNLKEASLAMGEKGGLDKLLLRQQMLDELKKQEAKTPEEFKDDVKTTRIKALARAKKGLKGLINDKYLGGRKYPGISNKLIKFEGNIYALNKTTFCSVRSLINHVAPKGGYTQNAINEIHNYLLNELSIRDVSTSTTPEEQKNIRNSLFKIDASDTKMKPKEWGIKEKSPNEYSTKMNNAQIGDVKAVIPPVPVKLLAKNRGIDNYARTIETKESGNKIYDDFGNVAGTLKKGTKVTSEFKLDYWIGWTDTNNHRVWVRKHSVNISSPSHKPTATSNNIKPEPGMSATLVIDANSVSARPNRSKWERLKKGSSFVITDVDVKKGGVGYNTGFSTAWVRNEVIKVTGGKQKLSPATPVASVSSPKTSLKNLKSMDTFLKTKKVSEAPKNLQLKQEDAVKLAVMKEWVVDTVTLNSSEFLSTAEVYTNARDIWDFMLHHYSVKHAKTDFINFKNLKHAVVPAYLSQYGQSYPTDQLKYAPAPDLDYSPISQRSINKEIKNIDAEYKQYRIQNNMPTIKTTTKSSFSNPSAAMVKETRYLESRTEGAATVDVAKLTVRDTPGGKKIGTVKRGQVLNMLGMKGKWLRVSINGGNGGNGWVSKAYVSYGGNEYSAKMNNAKDGVVVGLDPRGDGFLTARTAPGGAELGRLHNGDKVKIVGKKGSWYEIRLWGDTAWVYGKFIKVK